MGFVLVFGLLIAGLIALMMGGNEPILGLSPDLFAQATMATAVAIALTGSLVTRFRGRFGEALRALAIWSLIFIAFSAIYAYRFELQGVSDRILAELLPGHVIAAKPGEATVARRRDGHFIIDALANGVSARFVFDTGASNVVVRAEDAQRIGIETKGLTYNVPVSTANGMAMAAETRIATLAIGGILERNIPALVARTGALQENLLGQSFLGKLAGYRVENERLILRGAAK